MSATSLELNADPTTPPQAAAPETKPRKQRAAVGELTLEEKQFVGIVDALNALKDKPDLTDDLALTILTTHASQVASTRKADEAALTERKAANKKHEAAVKDARAKLRRAELWLTGPFPPEKDGYADFFANGPGPHDEAARLTAFIAGLNKHPDAAKKLPAGLGVKDLTSAHDALVAAEKTRVKAIRAKATASAPKQTASAATVKLLHRLTRFLRGWYGESSPELLQFGIKPRKMPK